MAIELYKEINNHIFTKIRRIINEIDQGVEYDRKNLINKLHEGFDYSFGD